MSQIYIITGHYGSGKTEFSVNFALSLKEKHDNVMLVDLDIVNPYFRSHDAKEMLEQAGITVMAPHYAGTNVDIPVLPPEIMRIFEEKDACIVLDVGGDDDGAIALGRYKQYFDKVNYEMYLVVNTRRPLTSTPEEIIEMKENIEIASRLTVTGFISDTNLADETTEEIIMEGVSVTDEVSSATSLPVVYVCTQPGMTLSGVPSEKQFPITRHLLKI
ncbi:MAG: hypothetical protein IJC78_00105 [Clostridia bacterium]|nr:hypothetical protein [Clostridia bacterium]